MGEKTDEEFLNMVLSSGKTGEEVVNIIYDKLSSEWKVLLEKAVDESGKGEYGLVLKVVEIVSTKLFSVEGGENLGEGNASQQGVQEKVGRILIETCGSKMLVESLKTVVTKLSTQPGCHDGDLLGKLLKNLQVFCLEVLQKVPFFGKDILLSLICVCMGAIASKTSLLVQQPELLGQFSELQKKVQEFNKNFEEEGNKKVKNRYEFSKQEELLLDNLEPPENFRELPVIPTLEELITEKHPFLRPNKVIGSYRGSEHYLDVQFRLLREDFVQPLRRAVQDFMKHRDEFIRSIGRWRANREQDSNVRLYSDVTFNGTERSRNDTTDYLFNLPKKLVSRVKWDKSKRLLPGCLVMLTSDNCKTGIFAITLPPSFDPKQRDKIRGDVRREELAKGILRLSIETGRELLKGNENKSYLMFECEAFFEAYRYNLGILQSILFLENDGPEPNSLNSFIVKASSHVGYPLYITNTELEFRLPTTADYTKLYVDPCRSFSWPSEVIKEQMKLDSDQYKAVEMALTSELAVIQGPPGTGKTYVGLQIVKTLLINKEEKILPESPFLVLCYTNHALDQFLELLLNEMPSLRVVRVGGQSKSEVVGTHSLFEHRKRLRRDLGSHLHDESMKIQKSKEVKAFREVENLQTLLADLTKEIMQLSKPGGIFNFKNMVVGPHLKTVLPPPLWESLQTSLWLGVRTENFLFPDFQIEEIIPQLFIVKPKPNKSTVEPQAKLSGDLKMKLQKQSEGAEPKKQENLVEEKQEEGEYDMDELMEHRVMETDDYLQAWMKAEEGAENSTMFMYIDYCSIRECMNKTAVIINELKSTYMDYYSMENGNSNLYLRGSPMEMERRYQKLIDRIRDLRMRQFELTNRTNLFSAIFTLYKEERLEFPNVDKVFRKSQDGVKYEVQNKDVIYYPLRLKWGIYFKVVEIALEFAKKYRDVVVHRLENAKKKYAQELQKLDGCILRNADIIGMTTTGAAKMHGLLELAKPEIVIVEEAAEILEAHIVTSLTEDCKHLILIGDHLQLQPSVNIFELETKYKLNVSLFERMILNGVPLCTLKTQHRMRPEISNLVVGTIYEELYDHETVHAYPTVNGIKKSLFFINHNQPEETDPDLLSKSNRYEADFLVGLCDYLLKQGYEHKQITILTTYTGQMFLLKKLIPPTCRGVRVTCVDNFQGEENDIILLSLVRSNEENKVGFVGKENRICVALSRARHGLFVVGNMDVLVSASKTWRRIHKKLTDGQNIGPALELICKRHGRVTEVKYGNEFYPLVKGGCKEKCGAELSCSHTCTQICHAVDQAHEKYNCMERCVKTCALNHQCHSVCSETCPPCIVPVLKTLRCRHEEKIACRRDPDKILCRVPVMRTLSCKLKHEREVECHVDFATLKCKVLVEKVLPCLHVRMVECDVAPVDVKCDVEDEKVLPCRHKRVMKCYQSVNNVKCDLLVDKELPRCGHVKNMKCFKSVTDEECSVVTDVVVPDCFHVMKLPCYKSAYPKCTRKCGNMLSCGHRCDMSCHASRDPDHKTYKCKEKCQRSCKAGHPCKFIHKCHVKCFPCEIPVSVSLGCGHTVELECSKNNGEYRCIKKVKKLLPCGHEQLVSCSVIPEKHKCNFQLVNCEKKCSFGHRCSFDHACYEGCPPCEEKVKKKLECGHDAILSCHESVSNYNCREVIEESLKCGHTVMAECGDVELNRRMSNVILCKEMVDMKCNKCSDEVSIECCKKNTGVCKKCDKQTKMLVESSALEVYVPPSKRKRTARNLFLHGGENGSTDRDNSYNGSAMRGNRWGGGNRGRGSRGRGGAKVYPIQHLNWRR